MEALNVGDYVLYDDGCLKLIGKIVEFTSSTKARINILKNVSIFNVGDSVNTYRKHMIPLFGCGELEDNGRLLF